jgi:hypothetical protein
MPDETKNLVDVILALAGGVGALVAFIHTLRTWKEGQRWQRAEKLDKLIEFFETEPLLKRACLVFDWTFRKTSLDEKEFSFTNKDALLALKLYGDPPGRANSFTTTQANIRDAYDALFTFFSRLETALEAGLVESIPTRRYFVYWVNLVLTMKHHRDQDGVLDKEPSVAVAEYIREYANPRAIASLASRMGIDPKHLAKQSDGGTTGDLALPG